jgi:hypothetical protein
MNISLKKLSSTRTLPKFRHKRTPFNIPTTSSSLRLTLRSFGTASDGTDRSFANNFQPGGSLGPGSFVGFSPEPVNNIGFNFNSISDSEDGTDRSFANNFQPGGSIVGVHIRWMEVTVDTHRWWSKSHTRLTGGEL